MADRQAAMLRCPACGAPAAPEAVRCEYCRGRLASVSCPTCFALLFDGAAYCPHCGAARARTPIPDAQPSRCPACRGVMRWIGVGTLDLLECEACDGTWLEASAFETLCADHATRAAVLHGGKEEKPPPAGRVEYRPCPRCGKLMNRMNFGRQSGAIIDVCRGHGTFLDRGELNQVVRFIEDGGLDRARRAELDELREAERRLREKDRESARLAPPAGSFAWDERWFRDFMSALTRK
jgi:Zn-finger nucleic acid-binding protein